MIAVITERLQNTCNTLYNIMRILGLFLFTLSLNCSTLAFREHQRTIVNVYLFPVRIYLLFKPDSLFSYHGANWIVKPSSYAEPLQLGETDMLAVIAEIAPATYGKTSRQRQ